MKLNTLLQQLDHAGLQAVRLGHAGSAIVVTPHGGRVLGVFTHDQAENAYFINPEFADATAAKKMLAGPHILGGDRLWLAPERGLFFKGNKEADGYDIQPGIDPGNWIVGHTCGRSVRLVSEFAGKSHQHNGAAVRGTLERSIRAVDSPFRHFPDALPALARVHFAGYEIASSLRLLEAPRDDFYVGLWFLIQLAVPKGGFLYAPTAGRTVVTDYYEPTPDAFLRVADNHVRFKLDSRERHKIGIRKTEVTGRACFLSNPGGAGGDNATLVVRNFLCNPSGNYADVPLHTPAGTQDCIQSYNHVSGGAEGFGELEYHSPAVKRAMPEPVVLDTNQVWTFTGKREDLVPIAAKLVNLPAETFAL